MSEFWHSTGPVSVGRLPTAGCRQPSWVTSWGAHTADRPSAGFMPIDALARRSKRYVRTRVGPRIGISDRNAQIGHASRQVLVIVGVGMAEVAESGQANPLSQDHELFQMYMNALDAVLGAPDVRRSFDDFGLS